VLTKFLDSNMRFCLHRKLIKPICLLPCGVTAFVKFDTSNPSRLYNKQNFLFTLTGDQQGTLPDTRRNHPPQHWIQKRARQRVFLDTVL